MLEGDWAASFICAKHANLLSLAVTVAKYFCTSFRWHHMISCISLNKLDVTRAYHWITVLQQLFFDTFKWILDKDLGSEIKWKQSDKIEFRGFSSVFRLVKIEEKSLSQKVPHADYFWAEYHDFSLK